VNDEKKIQLRKQEVEEFFKHISNASKSVLGEISLKKVKALFEPHIGVQSHDSYGFGGT
jgi:hypothetical protein